jgi:hypothetical protein
MVDKTKQSPIPERPKIGSPDVQKQVPPDKRSSGDPMFVRGTIDPPTKKER